MTDKPNTSLGRGRTLSGRRHRNSASFARASRRWHLYFRFRAGRDWTGSIPTRLHDGPRGDGFETSRPALPRRPLAAMDQGQEPDPSLDRPSEGFFLMTVRRRERNVREITSLPRGSVAYRGSAQVGAFRPGGFGQACIRALLSI